MIVEDPTGPRALRQGGKPEPCKSGAPTGHRMDSSALTSSRKIRHRTRLTTTRPPTQAARVPRRARAAPARGTTHTHQATRPPTPSRAPARSARTPPPQAQPALGAPKSTHSWGGNPTGAGRPQPSWGGRWPGRQSPASLAACANHFAADLLILLVGIRVEDQRSAPLPVVPHRPNVTQSEETNSAAWPAETTIRITWWIGAE